MSLWAWSMPKKEALLIEFVPHPAAVGFDTSRVSPELARRDAAPFNALTLAPGKDGAGGEFDALGGNNQFRLAAMVDSLDRAVAPTGCTHSYFLEDATLRRVPGDLLLQRGDLDQIGPHLPVPGKRRHRRCRRFPHPPPQQTRNQLRIPAGLSKRGALLRYRPEPQPRTRGPMLVSRSASSSFMVKIWSACSRNRRRAIPRRCRHPGRRSSHVSQGGTLFWLPGPRRRPANQPVRQRQLRRLQRSPSRGSRRRARASRHRRSSR